jgi:hypothetical protein
MTYKEKAIQLMIERLEICYLDAEEIVNNMENDIGFKPCVMGVLNAPRSLQNWSEEIK